PLAGFPVPLRALQELAVRCGYPPERVDARCSLGYRLDLPELVLCPPEFDFPHAAPAAREYAEPLIDVDRSEAACPLPAIDPNRPLVYCAPGSDSVRYRRGALLRFLRSAVR